MWIFVAIFFLLIVILLGLNTEQGISNDRSAQKHKTGENSKQSYVSASTSKQKSSPKANPPPPVEIEDCNTIQEDSYSSRIKYYTKKDAIAAIKKQCYEFNRCSKQLKDDYEVVRTAIINGIPLSAASHRLCNDISLIVLDAKSEGNT